MRQLIIYRAGAEENQWHYKVPDRSGNHVADVTYVQVYYIIYIIHNLVLS